MGRERERGKIFWVSVDRSQAEGSAVWYPGLARSPRALLAASPDSEPAL